MRKIKFIAVITMIAVAIAMMPVFSSAATTGKSEEVKAYQSSYSQCVIVKWTKVSNADGYKVYQKKNDGSYCLLTTKTKGSTVKHTTTSRTAGATYKFKVRAYRNVNGKKVYGKYTYSNEVKVVYAEPVIKYNSVSNKIEEGNAVTTLAFTSNSKNANIKFWNDDDNRDNGIIRLTGITDEKIKSISDDLEEKAEDILSMEDETDMASSVADMLDDMILDNIGEYNLYSIAPTVVKIKEDGGEYTDVTKSYTIKPGVKYYVQFITPVTDRYSMIKYIISKNATFENEVDFTMEYKKAYVEEMYTDWTDAKTCCMYTFAFNYRGDYYTAEFSKAYDEPEEDGTYKFGCEVW